MEILLRTSRALKSITCAQGRRGGKGCRAGPGWSETVCADACGVMQVTFSRVSKAISNCSSKQQPWEGRAGRNAGPRLLAWCGPAASDVMVRFLVSLVTCGPKSPSSRAIGPSTSTVWTEGSEMAAASCCPVLTRWTSAAAQPFMCKTQPTSTNRGHDGG